MSEMTAETAGLTSSSLGDEIVERINRLGTTVLIATHDIAFARQFEHRRYHLDKGVLLDADAAEAQ